MFGEGRAEDGKAAAVVIAAPECKLSIVQNVIRRLSLSGYSDIVLMSHACQRNEGAHGVCPR